MAYHTVQGFIGAPQSLRQVMLLSIHGSTLIRWLREVSEQWNPDALAVLSDTVASCPGSSTEFTVVPPQIQALVPRLEPTEAGFLLAAIHTMLSNDSHAGRWDTEFKHGFQSPHAKRYVTNWDVPSASSPSDANESEELGAKLGETLIAEDLMQTVLEVQRCMSAKSVLKVFTATGEPGYGLQAVDRVADVHAVFQTYLETMNRHGIKPHYAEFEKTLESLGSPIPEESKGLNSLDYLMTV